MNEQWDGIARKRFGQHFLRSPGIVQKIIRLAEVRESDKILEIGPGTGALTESLLLTNAKVLAVELDPKIYHYMREKYPDLHIVHADAANLDWEQTLDGDDWKCVANLPYNVGTKILCRLLPMRQKIRSITVMLQKEVIDRIVARPGERKRGSLSAYVELFGRAKRAFRVPPGAFQPPPKVDSAVVHIELYDEPLVADFQAYERLLKHLFSQPRKTIRNCLKAGYTTAQIDAAMSFIQLNPQQRPATLTFHEIKELFLLLEKNPDTGYYAR